MALVGRLRLRAGENFLEARIASQRIPFPPQTKISERDATRKIRPLDWAGSEEQTLDQRDRLVRVTKECINQRQIGRPVGAMKCVLAFWLEFHGSTTFSNSILLDPRDGTTAADELHLA
jgi:hypothetical protein